MFPQVTGCGIYKMTTERQACGLGSFLPMSCRDRAEAFARRLQSRLQSLGRNGSRDGASSPADESSWLTRDTEVTSHQPRLNSSSESDIYFDFDLECDSPGSPVDEVECSETLADCMVNKSRAFHCPPRTQYSSESGCVSSPSTITGTSPDSDSSDGLYFDSENLDSDFANNHPNSKHDFNHVRSQESGRKDFTQSEGPHSEDGPFMRMNGHILGLKQESLTSDKEGRRVGKRNFRNAAGFRVSSEDKTSRVVSETDMKPISISDLGSLSSESSTADEYFECLSPKQEESLSEGLRRLNDSGYPNTAESSRCNSQNESRQNETNDFSSSENEVRNSTQIHHVSSADSDFCQRPKEIRAGTEESPISCLPDSPVIDVCNSSEPESTIFSHDEGKSHPHSFNTHTIEYPKNPSDICISSSSESLYASTLTRPNELTIECPISDVTFDTSEHTEQNDTTGTSDNKRSEDDDDDDDDDEC